MELLLKPKAAIRLLVSLCEQRGFDGLVRPFIIQMHDNRSPFDC